MILKYPMAKLAPMTLLISVFALLSGYVIFGEMLSLVQWVSCALFLAGIVLVLYPNRRGKERQQKQNNPVFSLSD